MNQEHGHEPVRAAQRIIGELIVLRDQLKTIAEGFAVLDFIQGHVATELPSDTARAIVELLRAEAPPAGRAYLNDLVLFWLENYRRAYSQIIMRMLEDGADVIPA